MHKVLSVKIYILLNICLCLFSLSVQAAEDLLIFPEVRAVSINDAENSSDTFATIDFFGSVSYGQFRLLGEVFLTEDDIEAERLQLGYEFSTSATAWLGRFHNPLGFWNTQYHHGTYLQTSISRPEIAKLEHDGGLFPSHVTGLLLETAQSVNGGDFLDFSFAAGTSPELRANSGQGADDFVLHPMKLFNPGKGNHKLNLTAQIAYRTGDIFSKQLGAFISNVEISAANNSVKSIDLSIAGLFGYWESQRFSAYSSLFFAKDSVEAATTRTGSFSSGYIQLDYLLDESWVLFGRVEDTFGGTGDPYLELMTKFSPETQVAGIRWDITYKQALKLEVSSRVSTAGNAEESFTTVILNWSAVFP